MSRIPLASGYCSRPRKDLRPESLGEGMERRSFPASAVQSAKFRSGHFSPRLGQRKTVSAPAHRRRSPSAAPARQRPGAGPKLSKIRQNLLLDTLLPVWHDAPIMSAGENQFSLTRVASTTGGAAKSKFLSVQYLAERIGFNPRYGLLPSPIIWPGDTRNRPVSAAPPMRSSHHA
jgi:hypothetical protein